MGGKKLKEKEYDGKLQLTTGKFGRIICKEKEGESSKEDESN